MGGNLHCHRNNVPYNGAPTTTLNKPLLLKSCFKLPLMCDIFYTQSFHLRPVLRVSCGHFSSSRADGRLLLCPFPDGCILIGSGLIQMGSD